MDTNQQANPRKRKVALPTPKDLQQPLPRTATEGDSTGSDVMQPSGSNLPQDYHIKFAEEAHQYVREYIRNADQKAGFFFAAATAILAFLYNNNTNSRWLKPIQAWSLPDALAFIAMAGLAAGACVFLMVVFPRLKGSRRGLIFFNAIAEHDSGVEYADEVSRRTSGELARIKLQHAFDLSLVCKAKYQVLRAGFWLSSTGAIATLLFLLLT